MNLRNSLIIILSFGFLISSNYLYSQNLPREHGFLGVGITYGADIPGGDLAERYGANFHAGINLSVYSVKWKGMFGVEGSFQFGNNVKEDVLAPFRLSSGAILGNNGQLAQVFLRRRGFYVGLLANKTLISSKKNPHSGLNLGLGLGISQHGIRIIDDSNNTPQFEDDFGRGYDRNTRGPALKQTLTYLHIGTNKSLNYSIGLTLLEAFTESIRTINFDTMENAAGRRFDLLIGIEATWYLPIRNFEQSDEIFY